APSRAPLLSEQDDARSRPRAAHWRQVPVRPTAARCRVRHSGRYLRGAPGPARPHPSRAGRSVDARDRQGPSSHPARVRRRVQEQSRRIRRGAARGHRRLRAAAGLGVADVSPDRGHVLASRVEHRRRRRAVERRPLRGDHPARLRASADRGTGPPAVKARLLLTGAGSAATSNLVRSLRAGYRSLTVVGCHSDRFLLKKSSADRNYLVPALAHPGHLGARRRVIARERIDLLIPTTDAEVRAFTRPRVRLPGRLFLPRQAVVDLCQDKYRLNVALRARGVPVPLTYPVSSPRTLEKIFARLPAHSPVWCRVRRGSGSTGAIPVKTPAQARSWIAYWT